MFLLLAGFLGPLVGTGCAASAGAGDNATNKAVGSAWLPSLENAALGFQSNVDPLCWPCMSRALQSRIARQIRTRGGSPLDIVSPSEAPRTHNKLQELTNNLWTAAMYTLGEWKNGEFRVASNPRLQQLGPPKVVLIRLPYVHGLTVSIDQRIIQGGEREPYCENLDAQASAPNNCPTIGEVLTTPRPVHAIFASTTAVTQFSDAAMAALIAHEIAHLIHNDNVRIATARALDCQPNNDPHHEAICAAQDLRLGLLSNRITRDHDTMWTYTLARHLLTAQNQVSQRALQQLCENKVEGNDRLGPKDLDRPATGGFALKILNRLQVTYDWTLDPSTSENGLPRSYTFNDQGHWTHPAAALRRNIQDCQPSAEGRKAFGNLFGNAFVLPSNRDRVLGIWKKNQTLGDILKTLEGFSAELLRVARRQPARLAYTEEFADARAMLILKLMNISWSQAGYLVPCAQSSNAGAETRGDVPGQCNGVTSEHRWPDTSEEFDAFPVSIGVERSLSRYGLPEYVSRSFAGFGFAVPMRMNPSVRDRKIREAEHTLSTLATQNRLPTLPPPAVAQPVFEFLDPNGGHIAAEFNRESGGAGTPPTGGPTLGVELDLQ